MAESMHAFMPPVLENMHAGMHFPTSGTPCDPQDVDAREIVAVNLKALMAYAGDTGRLDLASVKGLARVSGVSRPTIDEVRDGTRSAGVDVLQRLAEAFEIQAWTLLVPHLDPSNPPTKPISKTEIQLYKRLDKVGREYEKLLREQRERQDSPRTDDANNHPKGTERDGKGRSPSDAND